MLVYSSAVSTPSLSIVAPVFNEEKNLPELVRRLDGAIGSQFPHYEIWLINDGSKDHSWQVIQELAAKNPKVHGLNLSRNMGEHIAVSAGLDQTKGDFVVLMDSDLQDAPEAIPEMYKELTQGYDLVYAIRRNRQHRFMKRFTSSLFWQFLRIFSGLDIPPDQATLRIMTRRFRDALCSLPEKNRFVYGLSSVIGFPQKGMEVEHGKRQHGRSSYNIPRLLGLAATGVTSLSTFPLKISFYVGFLLALCSGLYALSIIVQAILFRDVAAGWTSLITAVIFIGGTQMMMIGVLGVYLGRSYIEAKNRPLYFVSDRV